MADIQNSTMYGVSFQLKYKNANQWQASDVLLAGEIGIEFDTKKYKLGDGVTPWSELEYYANPQVTALVTALTERVTAVEAKDTAQDARLDAIETVNTSQSADITALKGITVISANPAPNA